MLWLVDAWVAVGCSGLQWVAVACSGLQWLASADGMLQIVYECGSSMLVAMVGTRKLRRGSRQEELRLAVRPCGRRSMKRVRDEVLAVAVRFSIGTWTSVLRTQDLDRKGDMK